MIITKTKRDGQTVLAKDYKGQPSIKTFANRKQADAAVAKLAEQGISAFVTIRWPFLVVIESAVQS